MGDAKPEMCAAAMAKRVWRVGTLLLSLVLGWAVAGSAGAESAPAATVASDSAELRILNRPVVEFRANVLGATPQQRVERNARNIKEILRRGGPGEVVVQANPLGNLVLLDGNMVFLLTSADADALSGETLEQLTQRATTALQQVVAETRELHDTEAILHGLLIAAAETTLWLLLLWGLTRLRRWVVERLSALALVGAGKLQLAGGELIRRDRVLALVRGGLRLVFWLIICVITYGWLSQVFAQFPYTRVWGEQLNGFLLGVLMQLGGSILAAIPNLLIALLTFFIARGVIGLLSPLFDRVERGEAEVAWLDPETVRPTRKITTILIWVFALVMAYPYLPGAQTEAFKGMSVLIGLMVSLGASSMVGQAASGLILMYTRTLRRGEYVRIGEHEGTIVDIGMFATRLRTGRGAEITLPNSTIVGSATQNYSRAVKGNGYVIDTQLTIGYDTPWRQVEAMLKEAARRTPGILSDPEPRVFQTALSDYYPEYCLACQAVPEGAASRAEVLTRLHANIQDVFNEYGVQIMSPNYEADPESPKLVPPARWYEAPAQPPKP